MSTDPSVACPKCGVMLPTGGLAPGVSVQCARCGNQFALPATPQAEPATSGKATASLIFGLIPVPLLTGIPAVILGIWALFDIKRRPGELKGSGLAISGITLGTICSFVCTPIISFAVWFGMRVAEESKFTEDPGEVAGIAAKIGQFQVPDGVEPEGALDTGILGWRMAIYTDKAKGPSTVVMLMQFPAMMAASQKDMEMQMRQQWRQRQQMGLDIEGTRQVVYTIRGQQVTITENIGKEPGSGRRFRQYMGLIASEKGPIMVMLMTPEVPADEAKPPEEEQVGTRLTEEQVQQFFESFQ